MSSCEGNELAPPGRPIVTPSREGHASSSRASGSRSSGAARCMGAVPSSRRIPDRAAATAPESHGLK
jgi:hypothetical protein